MDIVVFGAGSLGSLIGGLLARTHDVTLVGRADHVHRVCEDGLRITGLVTDHITPNATTDGTGLQADLALVTVKSFDTEAAARTLKTGSFDIVCSLQNGMGNEAALSQSGSAVLAGTATYGARLERPGTVACTGLGEVAIGAPDGGPSPAAMRVGDAFGGAGLNVTVQTDMPQRLWKKLAINAGINPVTALAEIENGGVLEASAATLARAATRETARVARAEGVSLSDRAAVSAMEAVAETTAENTSSMAQDRQRGRQTEIEALNGFVVDRAATHGLAVPTNRTLTGLIRAWEHGNGLR